MGDQSRTYSAEGMATAGDAQAIYKALHENVNGPDSLNSAGEGWKRVAAQYAEINDMIQQAVTRSKVSWEGQAADVAAEKVSPLAQWAEMTSHHARQAGATTEEQSQAFTSARNSVRDPGPPPEKPWYESITPWTSDYDEAMRRRAEDDAHNRMVLAGYGDRTDNTRSAMSSGFIMPEAVGAGEVDENRTFGVDGGGDRSSGESRGGRVGGGFIDGGAGVTPSHHGSGSGGWQAGDAGPGQVEGQGVTQAPHVGQQFGPNGGPGPGQGTPSRDQVPGVWGLSPGGTSGAPGGWRAGGGYTGTGAPGSGGTGFRGGSSGSWSVGASGAGAHSGSGGHGGPGGSGLGGRLGVGGSSGVLDADGQHGNRSVPAGRQGVPGPAGMGPMGAVGAGVGGNRGEDEAHAIPSYLITQENGNAIVGDLPPTVPPVIGDW